ARLRAPRRRSLQAANPHMPPADHPATERESTWLRCRGRAVDAWSCSPFAAQARRRSCCDRGPAGKVAPSWRAAQYRPAGAMRGRGGEVGGGGDPRQGPATSPVISLRQLAADVAAALIFSTRLPLPGAAAITGADIARASWALPVAGAIVGLIAAAVYWLARAGGLPPLPPSPPTLPPARPPTPLPHP